MLKTCKRSPFDLRCSLLPPTIADRRPPNFPRTTVIASSKRISTNSNGQKKAAVAAKALVSESIISESQAKVGANVLAITIFRPAVTRKPWWLKVEMFIERGWRRVLQQLLGVFGCIRLDENLHLIGATKCTFELAEMPIPL